ncbi:hypothetical protein U1Q18_048630 [Sarracenia purpurea var. burkii]
MASVTIGVCARCGRPLFQPLANDPQHGSVVSARPCGHLYHEICFNEMFRLENGSWPRNPTELDCASGDCRISIRSGQFFRICAQRRLYALDATPSQGIERIRTLENDLRQRQAELTSTTMRLQNAQFAERDLASKLIRSNAAADAWKADYERLLATVNQHNPELVRAHYGTSQPRQAPDLVPDLQMQIDPPPPPTSPPQPPPPPPPPQQPESIRDIIRREAVVPPNVNPISDGERREIDRIPPGAPSQPENEHQRIVDGVLAQARRDRGSSGIRISSPFSLAKTPTVEVSTGSSKTTEPVPKIKVRQIAAMSTSRPTNSPLRRGSSEAVKSGRSRESTPTSHVKTIKKAKVNLAERLRVIRKVRNVTPPRQPLDTRIRREIAENARDEERERRRNIEAESSSSTQGQIVATSKEVALSVPAMEPRPSTSQASSQFVPIGPTGAQRPSMPSVTDVETEQRFTQMYQQQQSQ